MNPTRTNYGSWRDSARRNWCNGGFREALNSYLKQSFKQFSCTTGVYNGSLSGSTNIVTQDYFALAAEREVFGKQSYSTSNEYNTLKQFSWYVTSSHINKNKYSWFERSVSFSSSGTFCSAYTTGYLGGEQPNWSYANENSGIGISPFGCM